MHFRYSKDTVTEFQLVSTMVPILLKILNFLVSLFVKCFESNYYDDC